MAKKKFEQTHISLDVYILRKPENAEEFKRITNGCGPAGWKIDIIPDTIYGLSIFDECCNHDIDWHFAETWAVAELGNMLFKKAVHYKIKQHAWILRGVRYIRFHWYMKSVNGKYAEYHFNKIKKRG